MHPKVRVLHVISGLGPGGAEIVLYRLATRTRAAAHEVICLGPRDWYSDRLEEKGVPVEHIDIWSPLAMPRRLQRLYRAIKESRADVVQCWMYRANLVGGILGWLARKPVIWNIRCSDFHLYPLPTRALARVGGLLARWLPKHVLNCSIASCRAHARIGYGRVPGTVIANGYDPSLFCPDDAARVATRRSLGIERDCFLVGTIGRWNSQKAYPVLLQAVRLLRDRAVSVRLLLIGRGLDSENPQLARIVDECGCNEIVLGLGYRSDMADIARALDLHVLPSFTEGFPNVVAETMLCGTPNIVTDVGDSSLIVGHSGWVVPAGDAAALADAIELAHAEWSAAKQQWVQRRSAARRRIADNFSLRQMVDSYERLWRQVAAEQVTNTSRSTSAGDNAASPLRIVHVINGLGLGGAETLLYRLTTGDSRNRHVVVSLAGIGWYGALLRANGVLVHDLDMRSPAHVPRAALRLRQIIRVADPDVVQCWMYRSNLFGGLVARLAGKPVVWGIHNCSFEPLRLASRSLVYLGGKLAGRIPDFVVNCSSASYEIHNKLGYAAARGRVINNGYDTASFRADEGARQSARRLLGMRPDEFAIGSIARWDPLKDIPNLLRAVRIAHDQISFQFFLIGAGLDGSNLRLRELLEQLGCTEFVVPLGPRSDIADVARALDLHVLASRTEAFPNVVAETMLCETPNAVTDVGDCSYIIGESGWIAPPQDPERLAEAIVKAYSEWSGNRERWTARRAAARTRISENFSLPKMAQAYEVVWREVASGSGPAAKEQLGTAGVRLYSNE